ncbi:MAG TPA: aromatic amino acid lyase, partial [Thermaerobacter sp.]
MTGPGAGEVGHQGGGYPTDGHRQVVLDGRSLTLAAVEAVARHGVPVRLDPGARRRMEASRRRVEQAVAAGEILYGVTTGFGKLADVAIEPSDARRLQENLLRSHAAGVGPPLPAEVVRAMMLLRANALARGFSGVRPVVVERLLDLLNRAVHPVIPSRGSLGASGDLAPLAHLALVLIGRGEAEVAGQRLPGREALARAGLEPLVLEPKEGLALINGTQAMTALGALAVRDGFYLALVADLAGALTLQALRGIPDAFDERIHALRPHAGQRAAAAHLRRLLAGSRLTTRAGELRVQDAYSLRCMPQVHGAVRDALVHAAGVLAVEANSVTDNPLVFPGGDVLSGGNFHGEPVALVLDYAAAALAELGSIAER